MTLSETHDALTALGLTAPEQEVPSFTDEPKIPAFLCYPSQRSVALFPSAEGVNGSGFHPDAERARLQSVAECVERLCVANPPADGFVQGTVREVPRAVEPAVFRVHSRQQLDDFSAFERTAADSEYRWWPALDIGGQEEVAIPAQLVFLSDFCHDEFLIRGEQISTGAALGPKGTEMALRSGLLEVVERDAAMSSYLKRESPPRILDFSGRIGETIEYLRRYRLEPFLLDVTTDLGIPAVVAVTIDRTGLGPAVNVGCAADLNYEDAILSALYESIQTRNPGRLYWNSSPDASARAEGPSTIEERFDDWYPVQRLPDLDFWLESPARVAWDDLAEKIITPDQARAAILDRGFHIYVADVTAPVVRDAGFEVLRVVVPELHPLYLTERNKMLYSVHHGDIADDPSLSPHPIL
jgi:ribosomal protein S12 methylthiotransferase accessory factor